MEKGTSKNPVVSVTWAEDTDNQKILELSPRCYQSGMITMYPDRSPVFNRLHKLIDVESYHSLAVVGDRAVGLLGTIHETMYFKDQPIRMAYFMDFKVDPDFRRGLTAYRMVKHTIEKEVSDGTRLGLATLLKNNEAPMAFTKGRIGFPASLYLGDNRVFSCVPVRMLKPDQAYTIEVPTEADISELVDLYNRFYSTYRLAPRMTEELFHHYTRNIKGLSLSEFRVARREGKVLAVMALWDEEPYRRYWVTRSNIRVKLISALVKVLSLFTRVPEPIKINSPLKQLSVVLYAHDQSTAALGALFRDANNRHVGGHYSLIQVQIHEDDPANASLKGLTGISIFSEIHLFTDTHQLAREIQNEPGVVHLEFPNYI
ncbi:MAG: hypothetical protein A2X22_04860 [Bacteroidetes bacterium GWF2_49_14]|nr:MAG: hypothetical protein A2X22_04860 [Bacteroidetes bacterium GWF2_49_14]